MNKFLKSREISTKSSLEALRWNYCVMNEGQGHQILKAYSDADFIIGLNNQYGPDFFLDNYATYFKNKLLLATETPLEKLGSDKESRLAYFKNKLSRIKNEMTDKNGLLYFVGVPDNELEEFLEIKNLFPAKN